MVALLFSPMPFSLLDIFQNVLPKLTKVVKDRNCVCVCTCLRAYDMPISPSLTALRLGMFYYIPNSPSKIYFLDRYANVILGFLQLF